ncbi:MAG: hypothetical protein IJO73_08010 [Clostridia bacterium]|nr:hypothetical protein [Clostridia bacterium]
MKRFAKLLCIALCVLLCACVLFFAGPAIHHDCIGEDCRYCQAFSLQQELMRLVLIGCLSASFALILVQTVINVNLCSYGKKHNISLVTDKVKLTA